MPAARVSEDFVLDKIAAVFRLHGYEGASIRLLAQATGLERASLYHRFPGGKEDMARAVVRRTDAWFQSHVFEPLAGPGQPAAKVRQVAENLREFYRHGTLWCVLDSMTIGGTDPVHAADRSSCIAWRDAFAAIAVDSGTNPAEAKERAIQALVDVEGGLVLARVLGDPAPFLQALNRLPAVLLGAKSSAVNKH